MHVAGAGADLAIHPLKMPRALFIVPSDLDSLERKGVKDMILERDEGGFFERVVTVHPFAERTRKVDMSDTHVVLEFALPQVKQGRFFRPLGWLRFSIQLIRLAVRIRLIMGKERIDIIRANDPYYAGLLGWMASRLPPRRPFCVSIHADYEKRYELDGHRGATVVLGSRTLARRLERFVLSRAQMVMPIRENLAERAVTMGAQPSRIRVIPHGIDLSQFQEPIRDNIRARFGLVEGKKILSFVGRLSRENYVDDVLQLAQLLFLQRQDFQVVIVGGGQEEASIRRQVAADPSLHKTVRLVGFQTREVAIELRRLSHISLCPMGGFSLIEACAAATPVLSYDVEWHHELVHDGVTGFLLPEGDVAGLARAAARLLDRPDCAKRMGIGARELAMSRHNLSATSATKVSCYLDLMSSRQIG